MKRNLYFLLLLVLAVLLCACQAEIPEATVEIDDDGYVIVNGEKTDYRIHTGDEISVNVNGYVVVNGKKTQYQVHTSDEISINADGLLVVNGQITEYEVNTHTPDYTVQTFPATCIQEGYDLRTCNVCGHSQKENLQPMAEHTWGGAYQTGSGGHWQACTQCGCDSPVQEHSDDGTGQCIQCKAPMSDTEGVIYDLSEDGSYAIVIGYTGIATNVRIASTYQGKPVQEVYDNAFQGMSISSVVIPNSVTKIGASAFKQCTSLVDLTIGTSVRIIGSGAFSGCTALRTLIIPDSVEVIGNSAFLNTAVENVTLGSNLVVLGNYAFSQADFSQIQLPASLRLIGTGAFEYCENLESVVIPVGVTHLGNSAFRYCEALKDVTIAGTVSCIESYTFEYCRSLENVTLEEGVLAINAEAFGTHLPNNLSLPNSILAVSASLSNLPTDTYQEYENGLYLGNETNPYAVFVMPRNKNLTQYVLHPDTKYIMPSAFAECTRARTISIPDGINNIGSNIVADCENLQFNEYQGGKYLGNETNPYVVLVKADKVAIHPDTKVIGNSVFKSTYLGDLQIPEGIRSIGSYAFYQSSCTSLTLPDSLQSVGALAFAELNMYNYSNYADLILPQGLVYIGESAFENCKMLDQTVLPDTVRYIDRFSFEFIHSSYVALSSGLTALPSYAFHYSKITQIMIPSSILYIAYCNFDSYQYEMESVFYEGTQQEWERIIIDGGDNARLLEAHLYFYSNTQPNQTGNFWHYVNGIPTPW